LFAQEGEKLFSFEKGGTTKRKGGGELSGKKRAGGTSGEKKVVSDQQVWTARKFAHNKEEHPAGRKKVKSQGRV